MSLTVRLFRMSFFSAYTGECLAGFLCTPICLTTSVDLIRCPRNGETPVWSAGLTGVGPSLSLTVSRCCGTAAQGPLQATHSRNPPVIVRALAAEHIQNLRVG